MTVLKATNITKNFIHNKHTLKALGGIDLEINSGDFVCLVGPSGCGKSTFLRILAGFEQPDTGQILFNGNIVTQPSPQRIMVFQEGALFPWLNVRDNVEFGLKMADIPSEQRHEMSKRYLEMMELERFVDSYTYQLSTGMKQRVAIARALAMKPDVLLLDEPFAALDALTRDLLIKEMQKIWEVTRKTIVFVTHNVIEATLLGTKVAIFSNRPSKIKKQLNIDYSYPRIQNNDLLELQNTILDQLSQEKGSQT